MPRRATHINATPRWDSAFTAPADVFSLPARRGLYIGVRGTLCGSQKLALSIISLPTPINRSKPQPATTIPLTSVRIPKATSD